MSKVSNPTKVITGKHTVFSYLTVNEPKVPLGGGTPKYSVSLIIPKSDTVTVEKIKAAIQAAYDEGPMNCPKIERILKDQEMMDDYIRMSSKCLSIKETARAIPVGMDVYESHPEYGAFVDVFGAFGAQFMPLYGAKKYGITINENGASAESKFPVDVATLEGFITYYETVYKNYTDTKEARKKKF